MNGLSELSLKNQIMNKIIEDFKNQKPIGNTSITRPMVKILLDLRTKKKSQQLTDAEFFEIVGETFKLNPDFFMTRVYENFMKKMNKLIGIEKKHEKEISIFFKGKNN